MDKNEPGIGVLLEQIIHQNDVLIEDIGSMRDDITVMKPLVSRIPMIEARVKLLEQAVRITNKEIFSLSKRTDILEQKIA